MRHFINILNEFEIIQNPSFMKWFGNSKVVDDQGKPLKVYHGTTQNFDYFMSGSHFGDLDAANNRLEFLRKHPPKFRHHMGSILPVYLSIKNPLEIVDDGGLDDGYDLNKAALKAGAITKEEYDTVDDKSPSPTSVKRRLFQMLKAKGYDGMVYRNVIEGNGISWIIFDPNQAKSATGNQGSYSDSDKINEAKTKDDREITFTVIKNPKDRPDHPWVQYIVEAHIEGETVGYLKIGFIPSKNLSKFYPSLWHYAAKQGGWGDTQLLEKLPTNPSKWTTEQKIEVVRMYCMHLRMRKFYDPSKINIDNINEAWPEAVKSLKKLMALNFYNFKNFHVDKPLVDYIQVGVGANDTQYDKRTVMQKKWSRKGIATALYIYGSLWLKKKFGLRLHASDIQEPEAKAAWDKMASKGWVDTIVNPHSKTRPERRVLNPDKVPTE